VEEMEFSSVLAIRLSDLYISWKVFNKFEDGGSKKRRMK